MVNTDPHRLRAWTIAPLSLKNRAPRKPGAVGLATPGHMNSLNPGGGFIAKVIRPTGIVDPEVEIRPVKGRR